MVVGRGFVARVVVVGQEVEEVEDLIEGRDVESLSGVFERRRNGHRDHQRVLSGFLGLLTEGFSEFLKIETRF